MRELSDPHAERAAALREIFRDLASVAQAGFEHDQSDVPLIDLPADTLDRANEIYHE